MDDDKLYFEGDFVLERATQEQCDQLTGMLVSAAESLGLTIGGGFHEMDVDVNDVDDIVKCEFPRCGLAARYERSDRLLCYHHLEYGNGLATLITPERRHELRAYVEDHRKQLLLDEQRRREAIEELKMRLSDGEGR